MANPQSSVGKGEIEALSGVSYFYSVQRFQRSPMGCESLSHGRCSGSAGQGFSSPEKMKTQLSKNVLQARANWFIYYLLVLTSKQTLSRSHFQELSVVLGSGRQKAL